MIVIARRPKADAAIQRIARLYLWIASLALAMTTAIRLSFGDSNGDHWAPSAQRFFEFVLQNRRSMLYISGWQDLIQSEERRGNAF
jgi:hypothetical protein